MSAAMPKFNIGQRVIVRHNPNSISQMGGREGEVRAIIAGFYQVQFECALQVEYAADQIEEIPNEDV